MDMLRVTRTYLQLTSPQSLRGAPLPPGARIEHAHPCPIPFFRYLYTEVGRECRWRDRLIWTDDQCAAHLANPDVSIWVLYGDGAPGGYFELNKQTDGSVEIAYFGLMRDYIGRGFGKAMLSEAANRAWSLGASRVWLHTCTLDDAAALPNYLARGFEKFRELEYEVAG
ncbi:MAG: GNAT family N-acetyltransferase [Gemmatimonadota bacterium]|nr:GNAT family N-acetyltransferase [Gemmatimonadota bacterium]